MRKILIMGEDVYFPSKGEEVTIIYSMYGNRCKAQTSFEGYDYDVVRQNPLDLDQAVFRAIWRQQNTK